MKKTYKICVICVGVMAAAIAYAAYRLFEFRKYYGEAEPLVELVWSLANESAEFARINGRRPVDLKEIDTFSVSHDFSPLQPYHPEFMTDGPVYFRLRVNREYSFIIDAAFAPEWDVAEIRKGK